MEWLKDAEELCGCTERFHAAYPDEQPSIALALAKECRKLIAAVRLAERDIKCAMAQEDPTCIKEELETLLSRLRSGDVGGE